MNAVKPPPLTTAARTLLTLLALLALTALTTFAACADDPIPTAPERPPPNPPSPAAQTLDDTDKQEAAPEPPVPERNRVLIMRLTEDAGVYPHPASDLHQPDPWGANALLLSDGWLTDADGQVWLRLDMNNDRVGWIKLDESPLTLAEAQTLPIVGLPALPTADLPTHTAGAAAVTLLGRSEDGRHVAVGLTEHGSPRFWIHRRDLPHAVDPRALPVYDGPIWGEWVFAKNEVQAVASRSWHRLPMAVRPQGAAALHQLSGNDYGILGRSPDSDWVALLVETLDPTYVWTRADAVELNRPVEELPIFVGPWMTAIELEPDAGAEPTVSYAPPLYHWQWRDDGTIVGSNSDGLRRWDPTSGELDHFADPQWVRYSPDGRYAASGCCQDYQAGDLMRDVTITPVDGGEPLVFREANQAYFTHHATDPTLRWSPNSRYLVSDIDRIGEQQQDSRTVILGIDGSRVELAVDAWRLGWLPDGTLYQQTGSVIQIYAPDGALLREFEFEGWARFPIGVTDDLQVIATESDDPEQYLLLDLRTGERTALPARLAARDPSGGTGWAALSVSNDAVYLAWQTTGSGEPDDGPLLYRYDIGSGETAPVDGAPTAPADDAGWAAALCSDRCASIAFSWYQGPLLLVDNASGRSVAAALPQQRRRFDLIEWSPDGAQLLIRLVLSTNPVDPEGFAAMAAGGWLYGVDYGVAEYRIISAADGSTQSRFRAPLDQCWSDGHTAAWSPDGRWLAFGGLVVDCT